MFVRKSRLDKIEVDIAVLKQNINDVNIAFNCFLNADKKKQIDKRKKPNAIKK